MIPAGREKAGLPQAAPDRQRIEAIIREASAGSRFTAKQRRREEQLELRIATLRAQAAALTASEIKAAEGEADGWLQEERRFDRLRVHLDMDAFFAAVEGLDDPSLRDLPMAVGGEAMLSTANYEARKWGVSAAMPGYIARRLCPQLRIVPPRFERYREMSQIVHSVLRRYDPQLRPSWSLDEAALDLTAHLELVGEGAGAVVEEMRGEVTRATGGLTCSAGLAPTAALAKICSNQRKPNGQFHLAATTAAEIIAFLHPLPLRKINGIGPVTARLLEAALGVRTCGEAWAQRGPILCLFTRLQAEFILRSAIGLECTTSSEAAGEDGEGPQRSISVERTISSRGLEDLSEQLALLKSLAQELSQQLEEATLKGRTVGIKLKDIDFDTTTRAQTLPEPIQEAEDLYRIASKLLLRHRPSLPLRLIGIRLSNLCEGETETERITIDRFLLRKREGPEVCPVCGVVTLDPEDNLAMNAHIDECLTRQALQETCTPTVAEASPPKKSKKVEASSPTKKAKTSSGPLDRFFVKK